MQVAKWGNSLAVRLPVSLVEVLGLKAGDDIEISVAGERSFEVARDTSRADAIARLRALNLTLPPGYKFKRSDAYEE